MDNAPEASRLLNGSRPGKLLVERADGLELLAQVGH